MADNDPYLASIGKQLENQSGQVAEMRKDVTELRIAFAAMKATIEAQQQAVHSEITNVKDRTTISTEVNWKWISVVMAIIGLLVGVVYAVMKK